MLGPGGRIRVPRFRGGRGRATRSARIRDRLGPPHKAHTKDPHRCGKWPTGTFHSQVGNLGPGTASGVDPFFCGTLVTAPGQSVGSTGGVVQSTVTRRARLRDRESGGTTSVPRYTMGVARVRVTSHEIGPWGSSPAGESTGRRTDNSRSKRLVDGTSGSTKGSDQRGVRRSPVR